MLEEWGFGGRITRPRWLESKADNTFRLLADAELEQQSSEVLCAWFSATKATDRIHVTDAAVSLAIAGLPGPPVGVSHQRSLKPRQISRGKP